MREGIYIFVWKGKGSVLSRASRVVDHLHKKKVGRRKKHRAELIKILVSILTVLSVTFMNRRRPLVSSCLRLNTATTDDFPSL